MRFRAVLAALIMMATAACQVVKVDPSAEALSRAIFEDLRLGRTEAVLDRLPPKLHTARTFEALTTLRRLVLPGEPRSVKVVGVNIVDVNGKGRLEQVALEYDYGDRTTLLQTRLFQPKGANGWVVESLKVNTATARQLSANRFTLSGKPIGALVFLAFAVISPLLMLTAVIKVLLTPGLKHKWLWAPLCVLGLFTLRVNWTTGLLAVNWLSVQLVGFGMGSGASKFDPWFVTATLPIGALLVLGGLWATPLPARKAST